jgi:pyruvate ferredoxin oxidoreductase alpha subunit
MVCQDGFITSHCVETAEMIDDDTVKDFIGSYTPHYPLLDVDKPVTYGPLDLFDYYFEHKRQQLLAIENSKKVIREVFDAFSKISGKNYDFFEGYNLEDAEKVIMCCNSSAGSTRVVVDEFRAKGEKVGLLKMRVFRPWLNEQVVDKLKNAKAVAVLDRSASFGALGGPIFNEVRSSFHESDKKPSIINYIFGLGGRELNLEQIRKAFAELEDVKNGELGELVRYLGVRE